MRCEHERMQSRLTNRLIFSRSLYLPRDLRGIDELWRRQGLVLWPLGRHLNWFINPQHARSSTQASAR
jgi:hypothetical protein